MLAPMICRLLSSWRTSGQLRHLLVGRGAEAAAVFDMLALLLAKARIFMRFAVAAPPPGQTECRRRQR